MQKDRLINGIIERLTNNFELKPSEVYVLLDYVKQLQEENKELSRIVASKVISDYDIDTPLKKELSDANLKIVSLEEAIHCYKQEKEDLIKWLEEKTKDNDLKGCNYEKTYICGKETVYKKVLDKVRGNGNV